MLKKALILSGIYWDETWQRHQQFAEYLASMGYKVYFVEHIISSVLTVKKLKELLKGAETINNSCNNPKSENIVLSSARFLMPQKGVFCLWNDMQSKKLLKEIGNEFDVVINYLPINTTRRLIEKINYKTLIYDCVRNFTGWTGCKYPKDIAKEEKMLCDRADSIFTDSFYLTDKIADMGYGDKVEQFYPVVNTKWLAGVVDKPVAEKITKVAYFGTYSSVHNDTEIYKCISEHKIEIHIWGSVPENLEFPYVDHGFKNNLEELSREITETCDAILIAYRGNMDGVIPAKLFQAISSNLPVFISSFYDSNKLSDYMYVFENKENLIQQIESFDSNEFIVRKQKNIEFLKDKDDVTQYVRFQSCVVKK